MVTCACVPETWEGGAEISEFEAIFGDTASSRQDKATISQTKQNNGIQREYLQLCVTKDYYL